MEVVCYLLNKYKLMLTTVSGKSIFSFTDLFFIIILLIWLDLNVSDSQTDFNFPTVNLKKYKKLFSDAEGGKEKSILAKLTNIWKGKWWTEFRDVLQMVEGGRGI